LVIEQTNTQLNRQRYLGLFDPRGSNGRGAKAQSFGLVLGVPYAKKIGSARVRAQFTVAEKKLTYQNADECKKQYHDISMS
jgi:hypothetical protein